MNTTTKRLLAAGAAVLLLLVGAWFWNMQNTKNNHSDMNMTETPQTQETSPETDSESESTGKTVEVTMEAGNYYFSPKTIRAKQGDTVKITLTGKGMMHNFVIDELGVQSANVQPGSSTTVTFTASKTGTFTYYCSIGSHRQLGQEGTLTIE